MKGKQNKIVLAVAGALVATMMGGCDKVGEVAGAKTYPESCWKSRKPPELMAKVEYYLLNMSEAKAAYDYCQSPDGAKKKDEIYEQSDMAFGDNYVKSEMLLNCVASYAAIRDPEYGKPCP